MNLDQTNISKIIIICYNNSQNKSISKADVCYGNLKIIFICVISETSN